MHISKSAGYAVHGLGYLISKGVETPVQISEISDQHQVSRTYLAKIFQQLAAARIVEGHRGATGGYLLARHPSDITLLQIVEAVDGPILQRHCCLGIDSCPIQKRCEVLNVFAEANRRFGEYLQDFTLATLVDRNTALNAPFLYQPTSTE